MESSANQTHRVKGHVLRLYVAGGSARTTRVIENVKNICSEHLGGRYELEIVDITRRPEKGAENNIIAVPTLVKESPPPSRRVVGDLSHKRELLEALDIESSD